MMQSIRNNENNSTKKRTLNENIKLPKNLRQIGQADADKKIYIEDYVMTYIKQMAMKNYGTYQVAVLLGRNEKEEDIERIYIYGAVEVVDVIFEDDQVFTNEAWTRIYEDIKKYFENVEIVGWYITRPGLSLEVNDRITKIHLDNFAGSNKVLLMYDSVEREEVFYLFHNNELQKQNGYYIFYERNDQMQTYMVEHKDNPSIEADFVDETSINIRSVIERKNNEKIQKKRSLSVMYAAATVLALFVLLAMATMISGMNANKNKGEEQMASSGKVIPTIKPSESTSVNVSSGKVGSIKDEEVNGETQKPKETLTPSPKPTKSPEVVIEGTDPIDSNKDGKPATTNTVKKKYHMVEKGDTLGSISLKYYGSKKYMSKIMEANKLEDSDKIKIGQKLLIPAK